MLSPLTISTCGGGGERLKRVCRWYFQVWIGGLVDPPPRWVGGEEGAFKDTAIGVSVGQQGGKRGRKGGETPE